MSESAEVAATEVVKRFLSGQSLRCISVSTGMSRTRIRQIVSEAGHAPRGHHAVDLPQDPSWWLENFDRGSSVAALAVRLGTNDVRIYRHLRVIEVPPPRKQPLERWLAARTAPDGDCLRWIKSFRRGRPSATFGGSHNQSVRRILWEHAHGAVEQDAWVVTVPECPHVDCVAIAHLRLVTPALHIVERVEARRFRWGESHGRAKLTEDDARAIVRDRAASAADLSERCGVSTSTIHAIRAGRRWAHLRSAASG
ncbi:hypothetical protein [Microbacterium sp. UCD-TDU]|uniref:hypothetical protein n=1 Tax=Microbacterium sp. UCD-TDU TaxID=1247714 RepID=UPI001181C0B3|nr:hypothetical protein [Microbacterium sp. UCD-TDU]